MIFEFDKQAVFTQSIDVVDAGNFALRCTSAANFSEYYIIVKTTFGKTGIVKFGPVLPELKLLQPDYNFNFKCIDYKETKINKEISQFINDTYKEINKIEEITEYEAFDSLPEISVTSFMQ